MELFVFGNSKDRNSGNRVKRDSEIASEFKTRFGNAILSEAERPRLLFEMIMSFNDEFVTGFAVFMPDQGAEADRAHLGGRAKSREDEEQRPKTPKGDVHSVFRSKRGANRDPVVDYHAERRSVFFAISCGILRATRGMNKEHYCHT